MKFSVEFTDTFGGEANYAWVKRFEVESETMRGAIVLANKAYFDGGRRPRNHKKTDFGGQVRLDYPGMAVCCFIRELS